MRGLAPISGCDCFFVVCILFAAVPSKIYYAIFTPFLGGMALRYIRFYAFGYSEKAHEI